ncbi:MAG: serine/threonine-protein kinase [Verrucomicrobiota bacterium]
MSDSNDTAGFVAPDPADLAPLFPGYEIQSLIATGGMGAVYCAVQKSLDRTVALKILPMELSKDAAFCAGFEAEAKAMARLNHPNLIGVYDFGEINGMLYIIMEYVPGKSIYHSAYGRAIDPQEAIRLVTGICNGLAHAHDNGILHRDIKPSNILLDLNAEPKIGDFGLARPVGSKIEEGEEIFGTPHYTAPEVVDNPHAVDFRADIFSVGVLLHELLTSRLPAEDPRTASAIAGCDPRFDAIIRKATLPLPAARYTSALEIAKELQAIAVSNVPHVHRGVAAPGHRPPPRGRSAVRHAPKKKSGSGAILVFLLAAAVAAIAVFMHNSNKPPEKPAESTVVVIPTRPDKPAPQESTPEVNPDPVVPPVSGEPPEVAETSPTTEAPPTQEPAVTPEVDAWEEAGSVAPKADVTAFYKRARDIMRDKAKPLTAARLLGLKETVGAFESGMKRQVSRLKAGVRPEASVLDSAIHEWRSAARVPTTLSAELAKVPELETLHAEYVLKQTGVEDTYQQALSKLSALYIVGLQKQVERYQLDKDAGAVQLVEKEISATRGDADYFATTVLGLAPDEAAEEPSSSAFGNE